MATLKPEATITSSQMPKFGAGQYGPEISALLHTNSDVIHSSLWGGDLEAFMLQSTPRGRFNRSQLVLVAGGARPAPTSLPLHAAHPPGPPRTPTPPAPHAPPSPRGTVHA